MRLALVMCAGIGCGGTRTPPVEEPDRTPAVWREVVSEHFVVWTNAAPDRARVLVRTMENLRQVIFGVSFFKTPIAGQSFVIAFRNLEEIHQFVPPQFIAHAWSGRNVLAQPVIALAASSIDDHRQIVTHELTHVVSFNAIANQPRWFAEGIAGYFETVRLDENTAMLDVGTPQPGHLARLRASGPTPMAEVFACEQVACIDERFYATTWALMTYLVDVHPVELVQYMRRLAETPATEQAQLWAEVFPALPAAKLDQELATWLHHGQTKVLRYKIVLRDWPVTERPISDADVLAAKGVLRYLNAPEAGPPAEVSQALALDATNVIANVIRAVAMQSFPPEVARRVTAAHPDDWRAWRLAWHAAQNAAEGREARDKTCSLLEAHPIGRPLEACARDAAGGLVEDARRSVFQAAAPQLTECLKKSKATDVAPAFSIEVDIADSGSVTAARVAVGSPETNACVEAVLRTLPWPHHGGTFRVTSQRPARK